MFPLFGLARPKQKAKGNSCQEHRIATLCRQRMQASPYLALRQLNVHFAKGVATVWGTVPTFHTRQMAHTLLLQVDGVEGIIDRIEVAGAEDSRKRMRRT